MLSSRTQDGIRLEIIQLVPLAIQIPGSPDIHGIVRSGVFLAAGSWWSASG